MASLEKRDENGVILIARSNNVMKSLYFFPFNQEIGIRFQIGRASHLERFDRMNVIQRFAIEPRPIDKLDKRRQNFLTKAQRTVFGIKNFNQAESSPRFESLRHLFQGERLQAIRH